ncbi:Gfo/Idh/MocA family protein [Limobrevibacterium gyesilva]|uniref:Gfo/Idh/MocA family oxidoreductase n=1 Tax=Limobrevibacterium gyesilva TaxID=2991712 RepID=A0AA41YM55_9PROT|nr:Gfo/Idh/MocA family oxidoreductase [Limobrevibacterium gyesilva]MCW3475031.1 Gfo/Idh/MocA family oxidoreductase [Limobrevibacterium gyesilva]
MNDTTEPPRIRIALFGAGNRGMGAYGAYVLRRPDLARVVAVADPRSDRLQDAGHQHGLDPRHLYPGWEELLAAETELDAVIIATPDPLHLQPALAAIERGVSILLEKPICPTEAEIQVLQDASRAHGSDITVAHVLRYTPFFLQIRQLLDRGAIGRLQTLRHTEHIAYWHFAHSYVRGNWRRLADASPMILAKACHDLDIIRWFVGAPCVALSSFGALAHFTWQNAPDGATDRCDGGCKVERSCPYSAPRIYLEKLPPQNRWPHTMVALDPSPAALAQALHEGPYGRCVYMCDNDVADSQVVSMRFANGVSATLNVSAFTGENTRTVHLMGSHGEITGNFNQNEITVTDFRTDEVTRIQLSLPADGYHGGGDDGIMADFLGRAQQRLRHTQVGPALTSLQESLDSHIMAFAAERSRRSGETILLRT